MSLLLPKLSAAVGIVLSGVYRLFDTIAANLRDRLLAYSGGDTQIVLALMLIAGVVLITLSSIGLFFTGIRAQGFVCEFLKLFIAAFGNLTFFALGVALLCLESERTPVVGAFLNETVSTMEMFVKEKLSMKE